MSTVHELKTDPEVFQLSWEGKKNWEIRSNDRAFAVGDRLILRETKYSGLDMTERGKPLEYTGRQIQARVTAVVEGYGLEKGWVILSVEIEYRYAPGMIISSESSEPALFRINIEDEAEAQNDLDFYASLSRLFRDTSELLSRTDIPKSSQDAIDTGNAHTILNECLAQTKSVMSDIESGKIKVEPYTDEYMPEVGEVCEISWRNGPIVKRAEVTYMGEGVGCYKDPQEDGREFSFAFDAVQFHSIKSERDNALYRMEWIIEEAELLRGSQIKNIAAALYDAGYRLTEGANNE